MEIPRSFTPPYAIFAAVAVAVSIFVLGGCGGGSSGTGAADESNPTTPGEGTAFEVANGTLTINDPENEYVVNRSLTEYLNSQIEGDGQPECRYNKEGVYPNQYECYVPVPEEPGVRLWYVYSVDRSSGAVSEKGSGVLDPNAPDPVPPENYAQPMP
jgi:hypothetical protein